MLGPKVESELRVRRKKSKQAIVGGRGSYCTIDENDEDKSDSCDSGMRNNKIGYKI